MVSALMLKHTMVQKNSNRTQGKAFNYILNEQSVKGGVVSPQCRVPAHRSRSSSLSLTVESALESFDFLNTSDFDDDDTGDDAGTLSRSVFIDMEPERIG